MMSLIALLGSRRGQSRILEAVIAASIIFMVFSVSSFLVRASDIRVLQERTDLDRLGYNILHRIVESGAFEDIIQQNNAGLLLNCILQRSLPQDVFFNLTIHKCPSMNPLITTSNITQESLSSLEIASTSLIYTSREGEIYFLNIILTRAGGG